MTSRYDDSAISLAPPSGFTPSVTHFKGDLTGIGKIIKTLTWGDRAFVNLTFENVEILESTSPVDESQPYVVELPYSEDRKNTPWDEFRKSLVAYLPDEANGDIAFFNGQTFTMVWGEMMLNKRDDATNKWSVVASKGWLVEDIEGLENVAADTTDATSVYLSALINGMNESDAMQAFYADEQLRSMSGYEDLTKQVVNGTLISTLVAANYGALNTDGEYVAND